MINLNSKFIGTIESLNFGFSSPSMINKTAISAKIIFSLDFFEMATFLACNTTRKSDFKSISSVHAQTFSLLPREFLLIPVKNY